MLLCLRLRLRLRETMTMMMNSHSILMSSPSLQFVNSVQTCVIGQDSL